MIKVGIPKENAPETRVATHPEIVSKMVNAGLQVFIESDAGIKSFLSNDAYKSAGAQIIEGPVFSDVDVVLKVQPPLPEEVNAMREECTYIGPLYSGRFPESLQALAAKKTTAFGLELLPRIARTQSMDILSSMSNLAGYKSVILAADHLAKIFPMLTTAAGTIQPAKVIVIGAGVAGLQAIATARRLGGVVIGMDTRPATEEQIKSLGADFVSMETTHVTEDKSGYATEQSASFYAQEQAIIRKYSTQSDVIITTALIPGKRAPLLITAEMVTEMKPGSVIVDLAADQGGNCELTEPDKILVRHNITIIGLTNLPGLIPANASLLYSRNLYSFLSYIQQQLPLDLNDDVIKGCLVTYKGEITHPAIKNTIQKDIHHAH